MPTSDRHGLALKAAAKLAERVPVLRAVPVVRLLMAAEVLVLGKHHLDHLTPQQRGQLVRLVTRAKGRPRNLSAAEQQELADLVALLEPRLFLAEAGDRLSPVGVPAPVRNRLAGTQPVKK